MATPVLPINGFPGGAEYLYCGFSDAAQATLAGNPARQGVHHQAL
jgi:hypothetical protein